MQNQLKNEEKAKTIYDLLLFLLQKYGLVLLAVLIVFLIGASILVHIKAEPGTQVSILNLISYTKAKEGNSALPSDTLTKQSSQVTKLKEQLRSQAEKEQKEMASARNEIVVRENLVKILKNDLSKREIEIEELKKGLADVQKSLEGRKKTEILIAQIEDIRYEIRRVEGKINDAEHQIGSLRASAASLRKEYELDGRQKPRLIKKEIVITESFISDLKQMTVRRSVINAPGEAPQVQVEYDINLLPPVYRKILKDIKKKKLKIGDEIVVKELYPQEDNITVAVRFEAQAIALETKRQRLLEKLTSLQAQINDLIAATKDG